MGLYQKYRPKKLDEVIGQPEAVLSIKAYLDKGTFPPVTLFHGGSGVGKDTLARIVCKLLDCPVGPDRCIVNAADQRGVDDIRQIREKMSTSPLTGKYRIWIFSECHQLTNQAQSALLEMFEDTPPHVLFMLTTTDPQKLIKAIHTRCFQVKLRSLTEDELFQVLKNVCKKAGLTEADNILKEIATRADGSARAAVQLLDDVKGLESEDEKIKVIRSHDVALVSKTVAQLLIDPKTPRWIDIAEQLKGKTNEEAENIRQQMMGLAGAVLLNAGKPSWAKNSGNKVETVDDRIRMERAHRILEIFETLSPYDGGLHRLTRFCWEATQG